MNAPFLYDINGGSLKIWFSNDFTTSSLGLLSDLELLGGIVLRRARFVSLFCFVGGGLVRPSQEEKEG